MTEKWNQPSDSESKNNNYHESYDDLDFIGNPDEYDVGKFEKALSDLWQQDKIGEKPKSDLDPIKRGRGRGAAKQIDFDDVKDFEDGLPSFVDEGLQVEPKRGWVIDPNPPSGRDDDKDDDEGGVRELIPIPKPKQ